MWKLLREHPGRDIVTTWFVFHRSGLALESVQSQIPELSIWMFNVLAVSTFFRTSDGAKPQTLGGHLRSKSYLEGGKIEFLKGGRIPSEYRPPLGYSPPPPYMRCGLFK